MAVASSRTRAGAVTVTGEGGFAPESSPRYSVIVTAVAEAGIFSPTGRFASVAVLAEAVKLEDGLLDFPVPVVVVPDGLAEAQPTTTASAAQVRPGITYLEFHMSIGRSGARRGSVRLRRFHHDSTTKTHVGLLLMKLPCRHAR